MDLVEYTGMLYMGIPLSDNLGPASWNPIMQFPITMEKVADAPAATPSAMKKVSANTARPETKVRFQNGKKMANKPLRTF